MCVCVLWILRQLIYNYPEQLFAAAGVMAIEHADFAGVERLALVTGTQTHRCENHPSVHCPDPDHQLCVTHYPIRLAKDSQELNTKCVYFRTE